MAGTLTISTLSDGTNSTSATNCIQGSAKAWVNFNGTGTVAIRASYNVSSITDNGTGDYTVNFTNAFADTNYAFVATGQRNDAVNPRAMVAAMGSSTYVYTTTTIRFKTTPNDSSGAEDSLTMSVAVFR
jgi:hypothetical protein